MNTQGTRFSGMLKETCQRHDQAGEIDGPMNVLAAKPDDMSLIP